MGQNGRAVASEAQELGRFHWRANGNEAVVHVLGELDVANGSEFTSVLWEAALTNSSVKVDLSGCRYLDSVFLNALMQLSRTKPTLNLSVKAEGRFRRLFEISGLDKVIAVDYVS